MPHSDVLDGGVSLSNFGYGCFEALWERFTFGLKLYPAVLKLALALIINRLPIIINDEAIHVDALSGKCVQGTENLLLSQALTKGIPGTYLQ